MQGDRVLRNFRGTARTPSLTRTISPLHANLLAGLDVFQEFPEHIIINLIPYNPGHGTIYFVTLAACQHSRQRASEA